jgi:hypothetical protein
MSCRKKTTSILAHLGQEHHIRCIQGGPRQPWVYALPWIDVCQAQGFSQHISEVRLKIEDIVGAPFYNSMELWKYTVVDLGWSGHRTKQGSEDAIDPGELGSKSPRSQENLDDKTI